MLLRAVAHRGNVASILPHASEQRCSVTGNPASEHCQRPVDQEPVIGDDARSAPKTAGLTNARPDSHGRLGCKPREPVQQPRREPPPAAASPWRPSRGTASSPCGRSTRLEPARGSRRRLPRGRGVGAGHPSGRSTTRPRLPRCRIWRPGRAKLCRAVVGLTRLVR